MTTTDPARAGVAHTLAGEFALAGVHLPLTADGFGTVVCASDRYVLTIEDPNRSAAERAAIGRLIARTVNQAAGFEA